VILIFIRHGATEANEKRIYCGFTDIPLSEVGKAALFRLRLNQIYYPADICVTSGMKRANETLRILYEKEPYLILEEFKEFNFGEFEMKSHDELCSSADYIQWIESNCETACPGGENRADFINRIVAGLARLAQLDADSIVIVCHGGVIADIMAFLFPDEQRLFYEWQPDFGRGYAVEIEWNNEYGVERAVTFWDI